MMTSQVAPAKRLPHTHSWLLCLLSEVGGGGGGASLLENTIKLGQLYIFCFVPILSIFIILKFSFVFFT